MTAVIIGKWLLIGGGTGLFVGIIFFLAGFSSVERNSRNGEFRSTTGTILFFSLLALLVGAIFYNSP